ncbi:hypothetical protein [Paraburkholderia caribensis]|uniref:hypothetical protein n=1 Tax=Paraburkholderia caribensis TaxID=75105 RepID=UPI0028623520|nr:hypothetical protein [Paraburkholderia caribensis]MDR6384009.1 hypothetical protein [Paraburkholderia caribensis]
MQSLLKFIMSCALGMSLTNVFAAADYRTLSVPWSDNNPTTIGSGLDVDLINQQRFTCLTYGDADVKWLDGAGAIHTNVTVELVSDYRSLAKTLNLEVDYKSKADVSIAALKAGGHVDLNVKYQTFAKDEARTLAIVVKAFSDYGRRGLVKYVLDQKYASLIDAGKFDEFREKCGTHTVVAQHNEAMVAVVILLSDISAESKKTIETTYNSGFGAKGPIGGAEISGDTQLQTNWKNIIETARRLGNMQITFESRGGNGVSDALRLAVSSDPTKIDTILSSLAAVGASFTQINSVPVEYLLVSNSVFGLKSSLSDPSKLETLNGYYLQLARIDYALSRIDAYKTDFPAIAAEYATSPEVLKLRSYRTELVAAIETCVTQDVCGYIPPKDLGVFFAEDIVIPDSVSLNCSYKRFDSKDGKVKINVLDNAAVIVRGKARLTNFMSLPTAILNRVGPDSTPPRTMITSWQTLRLSDATPNGTVRFIGQVDNQTFDADVEVGLGAVTVNNEQALSKILQDILGSIYLINIQGQNGFFVQNAIGPPFGGNCPFKKNVVP